MNDAALNDLADPPPAFGGNILQTDLEERLFIGTTYVYRGEYPRRDPLVKKAAVKKNGRAGIATVCGQTSAHGEDEAERDRMSPEERRARGKRHRGEGENRSQPINPVFGQRGLCG
jgi:hypothetical protein